MIRIEFKPGSTAKVRDAIKAKVPELVSNLTVELNAVMVDLMARVQRKLSGEVLQTRHGAGGLLGTVRTTPATRLGAILRASVQAGGGPAQAYAEVQEYGGRRAYEIFPVNKKALAFFPAGSLGTSTQQNLFQRPGEASSGYLAGLRLYRKSGKERGTLKPESYPQFAELGGIVVKHVHHPPLKERSYMRSALEEMRSEIIARLERAVRDTIK